MGLEHMCVPRLAAGIQIPTKSWTSIVHLPEEELLEPSLEMTDEVFHSR